LFSAQLVIFWEKSRRNMNIFQGSLTLEWTKLVKSKGHQNTLGNRTIVPGGHFGPIAAPF
jgi:hypothetical protein